MNLKTLKNYEKYLRVLSKRFYSNKKPRKNKFGLDEQNECAICTEKFENTEDMNVCTNGCQHKFHCECLQDWVNTAGQGATCPLCRQPIDVVVPNNINQGIPQNMYPTPINIMNNNDDDDPFDSPPRLRNIRRRLFT